MRVALRDGMVIGTAHDAAIRRKGSAEGIRLTKPAIPKVVIAGAGFAGLFAARSLARVDVDITLVDRHNYHVFQPLLYQVAVAGLAPSEIAWPIRSILRDQSNVTVLMDEVVGVDRATRHVELRSGRLAYDYLIVSTGARHSYFGHDDWQAFAPGLKTIDDATLIRRRILQAFEQAEMTSDAQERARLLSFVIVGGGPTGVELAGTIAELARFTLAKDFRSIDPRDARIVLVEAGSRLLSTFVPVLSDYALSALEKLGVRVRLATSVSDCDAQGVTLDGNEVFESATVIWAAGVAASPAAEWLNAEADRTGKIIVEPDLSVPGEPNIFAIGDVASVRDSLGKNVPGIAPAAKQQGQYAAAVIRARLLGRPAPPPFRYRHAGQLATIGRQRAIIEAPHFRMKGWLAWWIWGIVHIYFLVGVPSPLVVSLRWLWEYLTYGRGARLITGAEDTE